MVKQSLRLSLVWQRYFTILAFCLLCVLIAWTSWNWWREQQAIARNQRVLLIDQNRPLAVLLFQVAPKQLLVHDLRQRNWDQAALQQLLVDPAAQGRTHLVYSLLLASNFDAVWEHSAQELDKVSLLASLAQIPDQSYYHFLNDADLPIREQGAHILQTSLGEAQFDCPVALVNTVGVTGLANTWTNLLQTSGVSVIKKTDDQRNLVKSHVVYDDGNRTCQALALRLTSIIPGLEVNIDAQQVRQQRAGLVLSLGRDVADLYVLFVDLFQR